MSSIRTLGLAVAALVWVGFAPGARAAAKPPASTSSTSMATSHSLTTPLPLEDISASWQPGRQWMSLRIGFAKSGVTNSANGSIGGGFGYLRMLQGFKVGSVRVLRRWSLGGYIHFDQLGRFGEAAELEIPITAELVRHYRWGTPYLRPYIGLGGGGFYRKHYNTGNDAAHFDRGAYVVMGANSPLDPRQVIGVDLRAGRVIQSDNVPDDPVFGPAKSHAEEWSLKFGYSFTY